MILKMHFRSFVSSTAWCVVGMETETRLKQLDIFTETPGKIKSTRKQGGQAN